MKLPLVLVAAVMIGCSSVPRAREMHLSGALAYVSYRTPSGETLSSAVIELDWPIVVAGLAETASRIELLLSEPYFANWGQNASCEPSDLWLIP